MRSQIQKKPVSSSYSPPAQKATSWQRPFSDPVHDAKQDGTVQSKIAPGAGFNLLQMKLFPDAPTPVQAKLSVGAPGDKYEQQADSVATKVMTMPAPENEEPIQREALPEEKKEEKVQTKPLAATITPLVQRETAPEEPKQEEEVQTKALSNPTIQRETTPEEPKQEEDKALSNPTIQPETAPEEPKEEEEVQTKALSNPTIQRETTAEEPKKEEDLPVQAKAESEGKSSHNGNLESQLNGSKGGGSPLPDEVRAFMEPRFGADFSGVRVHTDGAAVQMNKELGAQAFAHGSDIYYGAGKSPSKDELTAHELTHIVQQDGGAVQRTLQPLHRPVIQRDPIFDPLDRPPSDLTLTDPRGAGFASILKPGETIYANTAVVTATSGDAPGGGHTAIYLERNVAGTPDYNKIDLVFGNDDATGGESVGNASTIADSASGSSTSKSSQPGKGVTIRIAPGLTPKETYQQSWVITDQNAADLLQKAQDIQSNQDKYTYTLLGRSPFKKNALNCAKFGEIILSAGGVNVSAGSVFKLPSNLTK